MGFFSKLFGTEAPITISNDIGIDLGTANTLVYVKGQGIVLREPSVVAIRKDNGDILAVGEEAKEMLGRTPQNIRAVRPMKSGVIADFDVTQAMISYFIQKTSDKKGIASPRVVVSIPFGVTAVEKGAIEQAAIQAGAREVFLIEEPMAAAIGSGLDVNQPEGNMIIDIGGGTSEIAVISLGGVVSAQSIRIGGDAINEDIVNYIRKEYKLLIGTITAENIKIKIGSTHIDDLELEQKVSGRDMLTGLPKVITVTSSEIREAIREAIEGIIDGIITALELTPPELSADIMERGIILTGGGALLRGLNKLINQETSLEVTVANNPLDCVAVGTGMSLEDEDIFKKILLINAK